MSRQLSPPCSPAVGPRENHGTDTTHRNYGLTIIETKQNWPGSATNQKPRRRQKPTIQSPAPTKTPTLDIKSQPIKSRANITRTRQPIMGLAETPTADTQPANQKQRQRQHLWQPIRSCAGAVLTNQRPHQRHYRRQHRHKPLYKEETKRLSFSLPLMKTMNGRNRSGHQGHKQLTIPVNSGFPITLFCLNVSCGI